MNTLVELAKGQQQSSPTLSYSNSDIEKRIGFPAGRFTDPGPLLSPILAIVATVGLYGLLTLYPEHALSRMFTQRGLIPYIIVILFFWSLALLWVKWRKLAMQRKSLLLQFLPTDDPGFTLTPESAKVVLERLYAEVDDPSNFYLTRRIHNALANLQNIGRIGDVDEVLRTNADNDEGQVESSYTLLRGFIWAIPVLGFIGTVWGLSIALGSFGQVLNNAEDINQLTGALQGVTGGLSTAFETTLQGLVAALLVHMLMISVHRREERFLDDAKDYCQRHLVRRLRLEGNKD